MNTKELFELVTKESRWWEGFCAESTARVIKHRHNENRLPTDAYKRLFGHFGYKLTDKWEKTTI